MRIDTRISADQTRCKGKENFAICPNCGQRLFEPVKGNFLIRTLCRRCGYIIDVVMS